MTNPLFSQEVNYSDPHCFDLSYSMANPVFSPEQMIQLQDIISRAVASAIGTAFASQKEMNIPFFYPDMPFSSGQDMTFKDNKTYYQSTTMFTTHLQEIVTEKNARTIHENLSSHLLDEAKI